MLKFYEGYVIKNLGTRPLSQTLNQVNLKFKSNKCASTERHKLPTIYTWTIFLNIFIENFLKYEYQERKVEQTVVRSYHNICF